MAVLDLLILFIFFEKYQWTVFNCEVEMYWIQSLLKSSEENYVVGKAYVGGRRSPAVACWASDHWVASSNPLRGKFRN